MPPNWENHSVGTHPFSFLFSPWPFFCLVFYPSQNLFFFVWLSQLSLTSHKAPLRGILTKFPLSAYVKLYWMFLFSVWSKCWPCWVQVSFAVSSTWAHMSASFIPPHTPAFLGFCVLFGVGAPWRHPPNKHLLRPYCVLVPVLSMMDRTRNTIKIPALLDLTF